MRGSITLDFLTSRFDWDVAANSENARVNSVAPANGNARGSAPLRLVRGAYSRFGGKPVVIIRDLEHQLLAALAVCDFLAASKIGFNACP
jgi:hypothetical protein